MLIDLPSRFMPRFLRPLSGSVVRRSRTTSQVVLSLVAVMVACFVAVDASADDPANADDADQRVAVRKIATEDSTDQLARQAMAEIGLDDSAAIQQVSATTIEDLSAEQKKTSLDKIAKEHPLGWALAFAHSHAEYIEANIRDYTCKLIKRERIDGELQSPQMMEVAVRCEQTGESGEAMPLSVFLRYHAPRSVRDRRVLFIDGENDGKAWVRKGGGFMKSLVVSIDPNSRQAKEQSNYPITHIGFDKIIQRLIELIELDMERDPSGDRTEVTYYRNAKVMGRPATHIEIVHPSKDGGFDFHRANAYIDDELHVPIRLEVYDWPATDDDTSELMEEYTYADLKLNVDLVDGSFAESRLKGKLSEPVGLTSADLKADTNAVAID
ncbi:DUF1571 domain-containing protein [Rhodopirellula halodulae]|uniref:DUF1571 domain-containing protein n=1 Tax=Rhodopirellula halodulae TaxID=2894198 RepID=UPI001E55703D|nr:DUF1571 domain-containing protein [Rhodopirellula sp. JC737]MCC9657331.1 DUF1571 domain-containing protein [Rhodopirellula sp. JC737]